jgi:hypothetical protein
VKGPSGDCGNKRVDQKTKQGQGRKLRKVITDVGGRVSDDRMEETGDAGCTRRIGKKRYRLGVCEGYTGQTVL